MITWQNRQVSIATMILMSPLKTTLHTIVWYCLHRQTGIATNSAPLLLLLSQSFSFCWEPNLLCYLLWISTCLQEPSSPDFVHKPFDASLKLWHVYTALQHLKLLHFSCGKCWERQQFSKLGLWIKVKFMQKEGGGIPPQPGGVQV